MHHAPLMRSGPSSSTPASTTSYTQRSNVKHAIEAKRDAIFAAPFVLAMTSAAALGTFELQVMRHDAATEELPSGDFMATFGTAEPPALRRLVIAAMRQLEGTRPV
jgi:hypothetical protein